jgi:hypothetical protein
MAFVGFDFHKIEVNKKEVEKGKISISNNISIKDVKKADIKVSKDNAVKFYFEYLSDYKALGKILLGGSVVYLSTKEDVKKIVDEWKKDKKVKKELMAVLINRILQKCNVQTIILADTVNMPPPVPMPKVKTK